MFKLCKEKSTLFPNKYQYFCWRKNGILAHFSFSAKRKIDRFSVARRHFAPRHFAPKDKMPQDKMPQGHFAPTCVKMVDILPQDILPQLFFCIFLWHILCISRAHLAHISGISWAYLGHISGISGAYLGYILLWYHLCCTACDNFLKCAIFKLITPFNFLFNFSPQISSPLLHVTLPFSALKYGSIAA